MVDLYPAPFRHLVRRAFYEYQHEQKIFDLPARKFHRGDAALDTGVRFHGIRAATGVGPAAGPQDQMIQNIVLSWLGGSRIIELKTVQIMDELKISRPCIDATNIGYNVEWSQELKIQQSLREYVSASMLIDILTAHNLLGWEKDGANPSDTIYDLSLGYDLKGIQSPPMRGFIEGVKNARKQVDLLRREIPDELKKYRDLDFRTRICETVTLSTFHGCPADEIDRICEFLLTEMNLHVIVKLNPTQLGKEALEQLLHERLGFSDLTVNPKAYTSGLTFDEAVHLCGKLRAVAEKCGRGFGVKLTNTLEVLNRRSVFRDEVMYMSGQPLYCIALSLGRKLRETLGDWLPISFSAGIDRGNFYKTEALGFVPVTTCTDLLRPEGYGRLYKYFEPLYEHMRKLGVGAIDDYIVKYGGAGRRAVDEVFGELKKEQGRFCSAADATALLDRLQASLRDDVSAPSTRLSKRIDQARLEIDRIPVTLRPALTRILDDLLPRIVRRAGFLNTPGIVEEALSDSRYTRDKNSAVPKRVNSRLVIFDCVTCDKCVPVCPNDANFTYETPAVEIEYVNYELTQEGVKPVGGGRLSLKKMHQIANYADFCNECGNCDTFCPEYGGPFIEKPSFFGSMETYRKHTAHDGFYVEREGVHDRIVGRMMSREYRLDINRATGAAHYSDPVVEIELEADSREIRSVKLVGQSRSGYVVDMKNFLILKILMGGVLNPKAANYVNMAYLPGFAPVGY